MDLYAALDYSGTENRLSAVLLSVLHHLSGDARDVLLDGIAPHSLGPITDLRPQHPAAGGYLDGWLLWSGRCAVALEAKVGAALHADQPQRYLNWLATRDEPCRVLWIVTSDPVGARALVPKLALPAGVELRVDSWSDLVERARKHQAPEGSADRLLLDALRRRIRQSRAAPDPVEPIQTAALALALGGLRHVHNFRRSLLQWLGGVPGIDGEWKRDTDLPDWTPFSVYATRDVRLRAKGHDGSTAWVTRRVEIYGSGRTPTSWPPDQDSAVSVRAGVVIRGATASAVALEAVRAALGEEVASNRPDFRPAASWHPFKHDNGHYHEVCWRVPFAADELPKSAEHLGRALTEQTARLAELG